MELDKLQAPKLAAQTDILSATLGSLVDTEAPSSSKNNENKKSDIFIASVSFKGPKKGYNYSDGPLGLGYYQDPKYVATATPDTGKGKQKQPIDPQQLLQQAEEEADMLKDDIGDLLNLDPRAVRRLCASFTRKLTHNQQQRLKYPDTPAKFLDSELALHSTITQLKAIGGSPQLLSVFVDSGVVAGLVGGCLQHENVDIVCDVLALLADLTDGDVVEEQYQTSEALVKAMLESNVLETIVLKLGLLSAELDKLGGVDAVEGEGEGSEQLQIRDGVFNILTILDNIIEIQLDIREQVLGKTKLLRWLLVTLTSTKQDALKQTASDMLVLLLQTSTVNQQRVGDIQGMDMLLRAAGRYRRYDPADQAEYELANNVFNAMCSCLLVQVNKQQFVQGDGVELMYLIIQQKRAMRASALKVLLFACTDYVHACTRVIHKGPIKTLFAIFMNKNKIKGKKSEQAECVEHIICIISNLFNTLYNNPSDISRLGSKFIENEQEKTDRLMELYFKYYHAVQSEEERIEQRLQQGDDSVTESSILADRMDAGLYTLFMIALLIGQLWALNDLHLNQRILTSLHTYKHTLTNIKDLLYEYLDTIGDADRPPGEGEVGGGDEYVKI